VVEVEEAAHGVLLEAEAAGEGGPGDRFGAHRLVERELGRDQGREATAWPCAGLGSGIARPSLM
jgi:hypothetical protein